MAWTWEYKLNWIIVKPFHTYIIIVDLTFYNKQSSYDSYVQYHLQKRNQKAYSCKPYIKK